MTRQVYSKPSVYSAVGGTGTTLLTATAVNIKAAPGTLLAWDFYNPNASIVYVQFFNLLATNVTLGTTVPRLSYAVPANGWFDDLLTYETGILFNVAISVAVTTTATGLTAPTTGISANILYL